jgi:predicted RNase H-like HicB family nuclease
MPTYPSAPSIHIFWSEEDHCFLAEIPELPGVLADGQTRQEALQNAERMERDWKETAQALGR